MAYTHKHPYPLTRALVSLMDNMIEKRPRPDAPDYPNWDPAVVWSDADDWHLIAEALTAALAIARIARDDCRKLDRVHHAMDMLTRVRSFAGEQGPND